MHQPRLIVLLVAAACWMTAQGKTTAGAEPAHFHHVRLNVTDADKSVAFYQRVFGAVPVKFRGGPDALFTERSFILFNLVDKPPDATLDTGIWHIGWGGVDVKNEYEWWKGKGIDIHTPLSPLPGRDKFYFYINGYLYELYPVLTFMIVEYPADASPNGDQLLPYSRNGEAALDDAVDEVIENVLANGGEVFFYEPGTLEVRQQIAAVLRY